VAVGSWPVPWVVCPPWGRGQFPGSRLVAVGRGRPLCPRLAAVGTWPVPWSPLVAVGVWPVPWTPSGRQVGVAGPLGPIWLPWGRLIPWDLSGRRGCVACLLDFVWPPWGRGPSPVPVSRPWGRSPSLGPVRPTWGCVPSAGLRLAVVVAWPIPC